MEEYYPLPIHELHVSNVESSCAQLFKNQQLVLLNELSFSASPTMSYRTVAVTDKALLPHIKLPISIRLTSVTRTISPRSCEMGPRVSGLLMRLCRDDQVLGNCLSIVPEKLGLHFVSNDESTQQWEKWLNVIYRENPRNYAGENDLVLPVAALVKDVPVTQRPLFVDIAAVRQGENLAAVLTVFRDYLNIKDYL